MAITTTLQPKYSIRMIAIAVLCLVFGVWGIYDYLERIPAKQEKFERGEVYRAVEGALQEASSQLQAGEPLTEATRGKVQETGRRVTELLQQLPPRPEAGDGGAAEPGEPNSEEEIRARDVEQWRGELILFGLALAEAIGRVPGAPPSEGFVRTYQLARTRVNQTSEITRPGRWDRATQWLFILCLPFFPYFLWLVIKARRKVYTLDADGTFAAPEGTFKADQIADIDMDRWMAKSIAFVVTEDGQRIKLDDYLYRNTHLIVGALASQRYPDQWLEDAKPVPAEEEPDEEEEEEARHEATEAEDAADEASADADRASEA
jgi:hypothetical protein